MEEIWCENYNYRVVVNSEPSLAKHRVNITQCKHEKFGVKIAFTFLSYIIKDINTFHALICSCINTCIVENGKILP